MEAQAYYRSLDINDSNVKLDDRHLIINCSGCCVFCTPFATNNLTGRKDFYLQYLYKGEMDVWLDGTKKVMRPGQVIVYYPHTEYRYAMHGKDTLLYFWVHFTGYGAEELLADCGITNRKLFDVGLSEPIVLGFEGLFREFIVHDSCFDQSAAATLMQICVDISRRKSDISGKNTAKMDSRIYRSLAYIHKNYNAVISVEQLAFSEHLSVGRYRTLFRHYTGLSPMEYLITLRINHSRSLILQTDLSIKEIAEAVGYPDQLYFSRIFRSRTGMTPTAYKSMMG